MFTPTARVVGDMIREEKNSTAVQDSGKNTSQLYLLVIPSSLCLLFSPSLLSCCYTGEERKGEEEDCSLLSLRGQGDLGEMFYGHIAINLPLTTGKT